MTPGRYEYCAIYVRGQCGWETVTDLLIRVVGGQREASTIYCEALAIDVLANPDHDPDGSEFVQWPTKLEIHPHPATPANHTVNVTARVLTHLWSSGYCAVAACDYETELPLRASGLSPPGPVGAPPVVRARRGHDLLAHEQLIPPPASLAWPGLNNPTAPNR